MARRPHPLLALLELRASTEFGAFAATAPAMAGLLPKGTGRTVLVLPGFMTGDTSTKPLRALLRRLGHDARGWDLGRNIGPTDDLLDGMVTLLDRLHRSNGSVDIVGWSLGGLFGREMARVAPQAVRQVITLGSPFQTIGPGQSNAGAAFAALRHRHSPGMVENRLPSWAREPIPVPSTSIYTKSDGVVNWHQCLNRDLPLVENVEVYGSHCGLGFNPAATFVIADRLNQSGNDWKPFKPPFALRALYPAPVDFDTRLGSAA
jgi:pimeloyl-ACP methyl ester carboxylesterase